MATIPLSEAEKDLFVSLFEKYPMTTGTSLHCPLAVALFAAYEKEGANGAISQFCPYFGEFDRDLYWNLSRNASTEEIRRCFLRSLEDTKANHPASLSEARKLLGLWIKLVRSEHYEELFIRSALDLEVPWKGGLQELETSIRCLASMHSKVSFKKNFFIPKTIYKSHDSFDDCMGSIAKIIDSAVDKVERSDLHLSRFIHLLGTVRYSFLRAHHGKNQKEWEKDGCYRILCNMGRAAEILKTPQGCFQNVYTNFLKFNRAFLPFLKRFQEILADAFSESARLRTILMNAYGRQWGDLEESIFVIEGQIPQSRSSKNPSDPEYRKDLKDFFEFYLLVADLKRLQNLEFSEDPLEEVPERILNLLRPLKKQSRAVSLEEDVTEIVTVHSSSSSGFRKKTTLPSPEPEDSQSSHEAGTDEKETVSVGSDRPPLPRRHRDLEKVLIEEFGFELSRQRGSHRTFQDPKGRSLTLAAHHGDSVYSKRAVHRINQVVNS